MTPDGTTYPWVNDLDGIWHLRPSDDEWTVDEETQAHSVCGLSVSSVHVSSFRPTPDPYCGEGMCGVCDTLAFVGDDA
jgi:hypothetical protein